MYNEPPSDSDEPKVEKFGPEIDKYSYTNDLVRWFDNLSQPMQVIVMLGVVLVGFTILNIFLKIVVSLLSVLILVSILYVIYRFFLKSKNGN